MMAGSSCMRTLLRVWGARPRRCAAPTRRRPTHYTGVAAAGWPGAETRRDPPPLPEPLVHGNAVAIGEGIGLGGHRHHRHQLAEHRLGHAEPPGPRGVRVRAVLAVVRRAH